MKITNWDLQNYLKNLVYAKNNGVQKEEVCLDLVKKHTISKIEDNDKFVIDLGKSTIRHKA